MRRCDAMSAEQRLECIDEKLGRLLGLAMPALGSQGQPVTTALVHQVRNDDPKDPTELDLTGAFGAVASFTVTNLGNTALLRFKSAQLKAEAPQVIGPLYLLPHEKRVFNRQVEILSVAAAGDGPAWVQVDAL